ncbi:MAG: BrnT family toxin [Desulfovibrio sp.]|nr:BrnT family toxin [Desulfovibrio sp.]
MEWDEAKRVGNLAKHGLDLAVSRELFADYFMERLDTRKDYGEDRWIALGMIRGQVVVLVYTERNDKLRPISLRKATVQERSIYEQTRQKYVG